MRRLRLLVAVALAVTACSDSELTTGPEGLDPSANITSAGLPEATVSDICGTMIVDGNPEVASPCDGDSNLPSGPTDPNALDPAKLPFTGSTFWLSSLEKSPSPVPANFGGLASRLEVRAYPYPNQDACEQAALDQDLSGVNCSVRYLDPVTEVVDVTTGASLRYETSWKSKKSKQGGPGAGDFVPNNTYWQIVAFLDFDDKNGFEDTEDFASRIIKWTDTPSSDNPLDGWSLDINWGSNQPIPFVLEDDGGCFGTASAENSVECLVDFDLGGVLTLITEGGNGSVVLTLGEGNTGIGLAIVSGSECEAGSLQVDAPTAGTCSVWDVDPPLSSSTTLQGSYLCVAESSLPTDISNYVVHMSDDDGVLALTPDASGCPLGFASGDDLGTGFTYVWNRVKRLFGPAPLIAGHGSSGSRLTTIRSEFQLVKTAQMQAVGGIQSFTVPENGTTRLHAEVKDHENSSNPEFVSGAEIYVYGQKYGATVVCPDDPTTPAPTYSGSCTTYAPAGGLPGWAGSAVIVTTGNDGLVEVDATVGTTSAEVRMLGCAIAVPGEDTPASADPADSPGPCNRDPGEMDTGPLGTWGFANGPLGPNIVDPFMSGGAPDPVWANDLPLIYTLQVCAAPSVDGVNDGETDPWSQDEPSACIPSGNRASFEVNVGGNIGGGGSANPIAQLEWFVGTDANQERRIYFGLEIPLASDPTSKKVNVAVTFDQGDGSLASSGVADEFDDQIVLELDKFSGEIAPTGVITDRYLKSSCTNGTSVCNSDDSDLVAGNIGDVDAQGAMAWDEASGTLFIELSQKLTGGDAIVDMSGLMSGDVLGFLLQLGVGNVQQGGTVYPDQSGGRAYTMVTIP